MVVGCVGQNGELVVKAAPLGVDNHLPSAVIDIASVCAHVLELCDLVKLLDVSTVGAGAENGTKKSAGLARACVRASHQGTDSVVDERSNADREVQVVNLFLQKGANVLSDGVLDIKALGPADKGALVDAILLHGETEGETKAEDLLVLGLAEHRLSALHVRVVVVLVVLFEEALNLLGQESEELAGGLRNHQLVRDGNLALGQAESAVSVQLNGADTEVCSSQINSHVQTLLGTIGHSGHVGRDLAHGLSLLLQTLVHLANELGHAAVDILLRVLKLSGDALGSLCERHAAWRSIVDASWVVGWYAAVQFLHEWIVGGHRRARGYFWRGIGAQEEILVGNGQVRQEVLEEENGDKKKAEDESGGGGTVTREGGEEGVSLLLVKVVQEGW